VIVDRDDVDWMMTKSGGQPRDFSANLNVEVIKHRKQYEVPLADTFDRYNIRKYNKEGIEGEEAREAKFREAKFREAKFREAKFREAKFREAAPETADWDMAETGRRTSVASLVTAK
jgi:uncharacterized protein YjbI with pentapeptide repeats